MRTVRTKRTGLAFVYITILSQSAQKVNVLHGKITYLHRIFGRYRNQNSENSGENNRKFESDFKKYMRE